MRSLWKQRLYQIAAYAVCLAISAYMTDLLGPSDFRGGSLTGHLWFSADRGGILLIAAILLAMPLPRIAAAIGMLAALLCIPLYVFLLAPLPFARVFAPHGEFSVRPAPGLHWEPLPLAGLIASLVAISISIRALAAQRKNTSAGANL